MDSYHFEFLPLEGQVNKENGVIKGVSVITAGVEARGHKTKEGHSLHTDMTTLKQMKAVGNKMLQVPVKWNHRTGADAVNGFLTGFKIRGQKLVADWHLLKKHERFEQAMELVETMPKGVGLSASFRGKSEVKGKKAFARCKELPSVDLVATPAANPGGMFEEGDEASSSGLTSADCSLLVDTLGEVMSDTNKPPEGDEKVELGDVMDAIKQGFASVNSRLEPLEDFHADVSEAIEAEETELAAGQEAQDDVVQLEGETSVQYFERRIKEEKQAASDAQAEADAEVEFEEHKGKVQQLIAANTQLAAENKAMAMALKEVADGEVAFSTPGDDGAVKVEFSAKGGDDGAELTDFETRVKELQTGADAKDATDAITFAIEENEDRYMQHLEEKGALA